ncbi:TetR/AcrR family transcriptional regulator [Paenibacillus sp. NPDC057934]|uniref:TetR/AcrR family transcriptional regulator n=1 Tax=Paenibacillus sp. NPDC057934 TaxID=3346282 RepID=UPI0036DB09C6
MNVIEDKNVSHSSPKTRRRFDRDKALQIALELFWRHGFEATSMADLLKAMGLSAPSLYATFGNKEELFHEAVELYASTYGVALTQALYKSIAAKQAIEEMLMDAAHFFTNPDNPAGCFFVSGATNCSQNYAYIGELLAARRAEREEGIFLRLTRAVEEGELPGSAEPRHMAKFFHTVLQGLTTQARDGASVDELRATVTIAMRVWPVQV